MTCPTPSRKQASRPGIPDGQTEFVFKWFSVSDARVYYMGQQSWLAAQAWLAGLDSGEMGKRCVWLLLQAQDAA